jgi:hypothetical protein
MARANRRHLGAGRGRARSAIGGARRAWPYLLMAWERWQSLSPDEKERYKKQARGYAERGKRALDAQRGRRPPGR